MSSTLKATLTEAMKTAMKAQDKTRLGTIRLIQSAIKQKEVDERVEVTDQDILVILDKMLKQRRDSIQQFQTAKRDDLVAQEVSEVEIIQTFLPKALTDHEINSIIEQAVAQSGAKTMQDMGKVMALVKPQAQGRADMALVSQRIKQRF
jgi:uncharacterized protein YqeY